MTDPSSAESATCRLDQSNQLGSFSVTSRRTFVSTSVSVIATQELHALIGREVPVLRGCAGNRPDQFLAAAEARPLSRLGAPHGDGVAVKSEFDLGSRLDPSPIAQRLGDRDLAFRP